MELEVISEFESHLDNSHYIAMGELFLCLPQKLSQGLNPCIDNFCMFDLFISLLCHRLVTAPISFEKLLFHAAKFSTGLGSWSKKVQTEFYQWKFVF